MKAADFLNVRMTSLECPCYVKPEKWNEIVLQYIDLNYNEIYNIFEKAQDTNKVKNTIKELVKNFHDDFPKDYSHQPPKEEIIKFLEEKKAFIPPQYYMEKEDYAEFKKLTDEFISYEQEFMTTLSKLSKIHA